MEPNVSLKLTQFGLELSESACEENVGALVKAAAGIGGFVRIDMESSQYTDRTLAIVNAITSGMGCVRDCDSGVFAAQRRGCRRYLERERIRVRLCKGAYLESPPIALSG